MMTQHLKSISKHYIFNFDTYNVGFHYFDKKARKIDVVKGV